MREIPTTATVESVRPGYQMRTTLLQTGERPPAGCRIEDGNASAGDFMEGRAALKNGGQSKEADRYYASPQQEHLWSLLQDDGGLAYRSQQAILIERSLDAERLTQAIVA